jgi:hypothetical protein
MYEIDMLSKVPKYIQIIRYYYKMIMSDNFKVGDVIPLLAEKVVSQT